MSEPAQESGGALASRHRAEEVGPGPLLTLVDSLLSGRAVIFGSLPPQGRDLDLLVDADDERAVAAGLAQHGFAKRRGSWARFRACTVDVVDVVPAESWELPEWERAALFEEARLLSGMSRLTVPSPHHALLILARRIARGMALAERHRERIGAVLAEDPGAFDDAREHAERWRLTKSVELLERAYLERRGLTKPEVALARAEPGETRRLARWRRGARRARRAVSSTRRSGVVITFSGLDGSGKSSQTAALRETLDRLGYDAVAVWEPIANLPQWLRVTVRAVKAPLIPAARLISRKRTDGQAAPPVGTDTTPPPGFAWATTHPMTTLRRRSRFLTLCWSMAITMQFAYRLARATWPQIARGRIVICDRYTLDSWVYLLYKFGDRHPYAFQLAILRALTPSPRLAYFLDVPGGVASARKSDFPTERNVRRAELYRERLDELGVRSLDGTRPREELCAEIAAEVWMHLSGTRSS
jgi:thymidylate kinase